jgi:hypothetical protein
MVVSTLVAEFFFQPAAIFLDAVIPLDVIEYAIAAQVVFRKFAFMKFAFDEFAAAKGGPAKPAVLEFDVDKDGLVEQTSVPFTFLKRAADEDGVDMFSLKVHLAEIAKAEKIVGPVGRLDQSGLELFSLEMHELYYAASPNSASNSA